MTELERRLVRLETSLRKIEKNPPGTKIKKPKKPKKPKKKKKD